MIDRATRKTVTRRVVLGVFAAALLPGGRVGAADRVSDADTAALVTGNSEFGLDLYTRLRAGDGNLFYSPYSISDALAMTYVGARGATADEMARTLRFSLAPARLHPAFGNLIREINGAERKRQYELYTANALWSQKGCPFVADFQQIAKGSYGAALEEIDFARAPETARRTINTWVEKQTQDRIKDLLREGILQPDTVLVLTNAIYFKSAWLRTFLEPATQPADFAVGAKGMVKVPLMRQQNTYRYLDGGTFQALDMPYEANELSMIIFLPRRVDGLGDLEKTLTVAGVNDWLAKMTLHDVDVALPRFKIAAEFTLERPLMELGMKLAFSRERADFSGMVKVRRVFVSAVVHKAYVDVNEKGTEAAAATGAAIRPTSRLPGAVFRADHPFLFLIRENRTGSILFAGRLANPLAS